MRDAVEEVLTLLRENSPRGYFGERVTQLEHALQCAELAARTGADGEMVIAALLHDIGHLLDSEAHDDIGSIPHDEIGAAWLLERGFSRRVANLVGGHVAAKRYLTATNPDYVARLSEASIRTLELQGGPMTRLEAEEFERDPLFREKLRLRSWDEQAKVPDLEVAALESYRSLLLSHLGKRLENRASNPAGM